MNPFVLLWVGIGTVALAAALHLSRVGWITARQWLIPALFLIAAVTSTVMGALVPALVPLPYVCAALAVATMASAAAYRHARVAAWVCLLLVVGGGGVYLMRGFGGFVLLACGYIAAAALLVAFAVIARVSRHRLVPPHARP